jgi:hypothetical protein
VRLGLAAIIAFVLLALPSAAAAGSILFVRGGDVWISTPDGTTERPLTAGGGFSSPSMADDGTIVALHGRSLVRLRPDGAPVGMAVDAVGGDWVVAGGPYGARVSPDGDRVAYWFTGRRRFCLPIEPGCSLQDSDVTAYAYADRVTDPLELGVVRDRREPSWYGSGRALLFRHGAGLGETVSVNRVGSGESDDQGWFSYDDGTSLAQGQLDHAGDRLAAVAGGDEIHLFGIAAPPPALPALRCIVPGGPFASPTWSPDGTMLAWEQADGVHVAGPVPDLRRPVRDCSAIRERRLTDGTEPYWGAADVPGTSSGPPALGAPAARRPARAFSTLRIARRQRGRAVRLRLRIARGPARVDARLSHGGTRAGRVLRRRARAGTLRLRIPLDRRARRALAGSGRLTLRLRLEVRAPGRATAMARRIVFLRA